VRLCSWYPRPAAVPSETHAAERSGPAAPGSPLQSRPGLGCLFLAGLVWGVSTVCRERRRGRLGCPETLAGKVWVTTRRKQERVLSDLVGQVF